MGEFAEVPVLLSDAVHKRADPTWFWVKHGADQQDMFNADCWAIVLLDDIKERCGYGHIEEEIDLQREDGTRIELNTMGKASAIDTLESKGTYILVKLILAHEPGDPPTVEMLWEPPEGYEAPVADAKGKKK